MESSRSFGGAPTLGSLMQKGPMTGTRETVASGGDSLQVTVKSHQIDVQNYFKQIKAINVCKRLNSNAEDGEFHYFDENDEIFSLS